MGNAAFRLAFLLAELPSQVVSKRVGGPPFLASQLADFHVIAAWPGRVHSHPDVHMVDRYDGAVLLEWKNILPRMPSSSRVSQHDRGNIPVARLTLDRLAQGGFIPDLILYLSCR